MYNIDSGHGECSEDRTEGDHGAGEEQLGQGLNGVSTDAQGQLLYNWASPWASSVKT